MSRKNGTTQIEIELSSDSRDKLPLKTYTRRANPQTSHYPTFRKDSEIIEARFYETDEIEPGIQLLWRDHLAFHKENTSQYIISYKKTCQYYVGPAFKYNLVACYIKML